MIDPNKITDYDRTVNQLQEFLLFSICVAGKNSKVQAEKLDRFINDMWADYWGTSCHPSRTPNLFEMLRAYTDFEIEGFLKKVKMGQYSRISKTFYKLGSLANADLDLESCGVSDLEQICGIGPKTARFFILHTRRDIRFAALDTHILKYLQRCGVENVPKTTPTSKKEYARLEGEFLEIYDKTKDITGREVSLADYDLMIWQHYSAGKNKSAK